MSKARNITLPVKDSDLPLIGTCRSKTFHRGFIGFRFDFWVGFFIVFPIYPNWPWLSSIFNFFCCNRWWLAIYQNNFWWLFAFFVCSKIPKNLRPIFLNDIAITWFLSSMSLLCHFMVPELSNNLNIRQLLLQKNVNSWFLGKSIFW